MKRTFFSLIAVLVVAACAGGPLVIPEDLSFEVLIQRAQESSDSYKYDKALQYYFAALERFGSESAKEVACRYEIAFIYYKQGKDGLSAQWFKQVLAIYETSPSGLPERFLILSRKVLPIVEKRLLEKTPAASTPEGSGG